MTGSASASAGGGTSLLADYTARFGGAIRRQQSTVALRAARMEAELAYKARGTFLATMNHELRTPLNAITGFAGLLKEADTYGFAADQKAEYLDHILESAELLLSHIDTLLEVADAESGGAKLRKQAFDLDEAVAETARETAQDLADRGIGWQADVPSDLPEVLADPDKITVALRHLVRFATAGAEEGTTLRLAVRAGLAGRSADWVYVALDTDRPGRSQADIDAAMRVFERVHEGLHRGFASGDLSLPIAKSFVELNGGRFNVKAGGGAGPLYRFALPRALPAAAAAEEHRRMAS